MPLFNFTLKTIRTRVNILWMLIIIVMREDSIFSFFAKMIIICVGITGNKWKNKKKSFVFIGAESRVCVYDDPIFTRIDNNDHKDIKQNCDHLTVNLLLIFFFHAVGTPTKDGFVYIWKAITYETKTDFSYLFIIIFFFKNLI